MKYKAINFYKKYSLFNDRWSPKVIAEMNNYQFKLARVKGSFIWHSHDKTDEVFIVMDGELDIHLRDKTIHLRKGEMYVVPQGVEHKPEAEKECKIMLIEQKGTVNTGDLSNNLTSPNDIYI